MRVESEAAISAPRKGFAKIAHRAGERKNDRSFIVGSKETQEINPEVRLEVNSLIRCLVEEIMVQLQDKEKFLVAKHTKGLENQELLAVIARLQQLKKQVRNPDERRFFLDIMVAYKEFIKLSPRINFFYYNFVDNFPDSKKEYSEKIAEILKILSANKLNFKKILEEKKRGKIIEGLESIRIAMLNVLIKKNDNRIVLLSGDKQDIPSDKLFLLLERIKVNSQCEAFQFSQVYQAEIKGEAEFAGLLKNSRKIFLKKILREIEKEFLNLEKLSKKIIEKQKICRKILSEIPEINEISLSENFPGKKEIIKMNIAISINRDLFSKFFEIESDTTLDFSNVINKINSIIEKEESSDQLDKFFNILVKGKRSLQQIFMKFDWLEPELQKLQKISHMMRVIDVQFSLREKKKEEKEISAEKIEAKIKKKMTVLERAAFVARSNDQDEKTKKIQSYFFTELEALKEQKQEMQSQIKIIRKNKTLKVPHDKFKKNYLSLCKIKKQIQQGEKLISEVRDEIDELLFPTENLAQSIFSHLQKIKSFPVSFEIKEAKEATISLYQESQNFIDKYLSQICDKLIGLEKSILASQDIWRLARSRHTTSVVAYNLPGETELAQLKEEILVSLRALQQVLLLPDSTKDLLSTILIVCKIYAQENASDETRLKEFSQIACQTYEKLKELAEKMQQLKEKVECSQTAAVRQQKVLEGDSHKPQKKNRRFKKKSPPKASVKPAQQSEEVISLSSVATQADSFVPSGLQTMPLQDDRLLLLATPQKPTVSSSDFKYGIFSKSFLAPKPLYAALDQLDQKTLAKNFQGLLESKVEWKSNLSSVESVQLLKLMNCHQCALLMKFAQFYESLRRGHFDAFLSKHKANIGLIQVMRNQIFHLFPIIIAANWSQISTAPQQQINFYHDILSMTYSLQESIATGDFTKLAGNGFFDKYSQAPDLPAAAKVPRRLKRQLFNYFLDFNQNFPKDFSLPDQTSAKKILPPDIIQLAQYFITGVQDIYAKETRRPQEGQAAQVRHLALG